MFFPAIVDPPTGSRSATSFRRAITMGPRAYVRTAACDVRAIAVGLGLCFPLVGCASPNVEDRTANEPSTEPTNTVTAGTWTDGPWPFTIERGELTCIGPADDPGVFIVTESGETFALNPAAIRMADQAGAMADLDPIWRDDPDLVGAKVNVSPVILYALQLC